MARRVLTHEGMSAGRFALSIMLAGFLGTGCALDPVGGPGGGDGEPTRIPSGDEEFEDRLDALGIVCESTLIVTGSVTPTDPQPAESNGCWPVGIWNVTVAMDRVGCSPQEAIEGEYVYEVTRDDESATNIIYQADPDGERLNLKITAAGDSLCHASFEHFGYNGDDRVVLTFQPTRQLDDSLSGAGSYAFWEEDPF